MQPPRPTLSPIVEWKKNYQFLSQASWHFPRDYSSEMISVFLITVLYMMHMMNARMSVRYVTETNDPCLKQRQKYTYLLPPVERVHSCRKIRTIHKDFLFLFRHSWRSIQWCWPYVPALCLRLKGLAHYNKQSECIYQEAMCYIYYLFNTSGWNIEEKDVMALFI